ncbi:Putative E3 ubiquitin-protein ligase LIN [Seminavis robusta]|uniref:E3 ubiquitin-protein ligase LIN n=1 Tax=Seminavis robusta TaxID=568900 RepID=A0A9N8H433_9STRA|nr:Putative E3 ubiquitin-protein ligase LIN [Seminavis robusta]|eukprot:Sro4_g002930.1 Putative E3 ubiquitin-protein ligase LIN (131) ;mRNA; f:12021-12413
MDTTTPSEYICCLTLDLLSDPVSTPRGFVFERKAIIEWLKRGERSCPLTREPLEEWELVNNTELLEEILKWKKANRIADIRIDSFEDFSSDRRSLGLGSKALASAPHLLSVRERILKRREQQFRAHLTKC